MTLTGEANEEHGHTADNSEEKTAHSQILKVEHLSWHLSCCCQARAVSLLDVQYQKDYLCCSTIGANILPARSCSPPSSEELVTGKRIAKLTSPKVAKREFEKKCVVSSSAVTLLLCLPVGISISAADVCAFAVPASQRQCPPSKTIVRLSLKVNRLKMQFFSTRSKNLQFTFFEKKKRKHHCHH